MGHKEGPTKLGRRPHVSTKTHAESTEGTSIGGGHFKILNRDDEDAGPGTVLGHKEREAAGPIKSLQQNYEAQKKKSTIRLNEIKALASQFLEALKNWEISSTTGNQMVKLCICMVGNLANLVGSVTRQTWGEVKVGAVILRE
ncbi:hypothetical protein HAX54_040325 [Datura stramonium]|uniref:Uncharacterized protein n=1 Tax=Datura stramonium TaxID=4076 RepID=A0ABS8SKA9_DATST|nr:hypothetical protein [Datura stramonium]